MYKVPSAVKFYHVKERSQSQEEEEGSKCYVRIKRVKLSGHQQSLINEWELNLIITYYAGEKLEDSS